MLAALAAQIGITDISDVALLKARLRNGGRWPIGSVVAAHDKSGLSTRSR